MRKVDPNLTPQQHRLPLQLTLPHTAQHTHPLPRNLSGDGIQFRDFLREHFPDLQNTCVGRAELSKRYMLSTIIVLSAHIWLVFVSSYVPRATGKTGHARHASTYIHSMRPSCSIALICCYWMEMIQFECYVSVRALPVLPPTPTLSLTPTLGTCQCHNVAGCVPRVEGFDQW